MLYALMITIGVALCVFSTVPVIIFDELIGVEQFEGYGVAIMFLCISIAVVLFITASYRKGVYGELLKLNERGTMGGNFVSAQKTEVYYENKTVRGVMAVFWPTITCIYLCVSFLTFQWHVTWVIWPVAAIINKLMETIFGNNNQ